MKRPMVGVTVGLTVAFACTGAMATDLELTVQNSTSATIASLSAYGTDANSQPVEDNVGFALITINPGSSGILTLSGLTTCQKVWLRAQDAADQTVASGPVDLCQTMTVRLSN